MTDYAARSTTRKLSKMLALSPHFQEECALYNIDNAETRIHRWIAEEPDNFPRPFAVIEVEGVEDELHAGGSRNEFHLTETLMLYLAAEQHHPDNKEESLENFWEWAKLVRLDVLSLANVDDYLNITAMPSDMKPMITPPEAGHERPYVWMVFRVEVGGHT